MEIFPMTSPLLNILGILISVRNFSPMAPAGFFFSFRTSFNISRPTLTLTGGNSAGCSHKSLQFHVSFQTKDFMRVQKKKKKVDE